MSKFYPQTLRLIRVVAKGRAMYMALHTCKGKFWLLLGVFAPPDPLLVGRCRGLRRAELAMASP